MGCGVAVTVMTRMSSTQSRGYNFTCQNFTYFRKSRSVLKGARMHAHAQARAFLLKGPTPSPRKQTSAGQGPINISGITKTGESWEGRCAGVSCRAK